MGPGVPICWEWTARLPEVVPPEGVGLALESCLSDPQTCASSHEVMVSSPRGLWRINKPHQTRFTHLIPGEMLPWAENSGWRGGGLALSLVLPRTTVWPWAAPHFYGSQCLLGLGQSSQEVTDMRLAVCTVTLGRTCYVNCHVITGMY